jgi:hypothetical protein
MRRFLSAFALLAAVDTEPTSGGAAAAVVDVTPPAPKRPSLDEAQAFLLASKPAPFRLVVWPRNVAPEQQVQLALRRPSVGQRGEIQQSGSTTDAKGQTLFNIQRMNVAALIASLFTVGPNGEPLTPVFKEVHKQDLLNQACGPTSIVEVLGKEALEFMGSDVELVASAKNA